MLLFIQFKVIFLSHIPTEKLQMYSMAIVSGLRDTEKPCSPSGCLEYMHITHALQDHLHCKPLKAKDSRTMKKKKL